MNQDLLGTNEYTILDDQIPNSDHPQSKDINQLPNINPPSETFIPIEGFIKKPNTDISTEVRPSESSPIVVVETNPEELSPVISTVLETKDWKPILTA